LSGKNYEVEKQLFVGAALACGFAGASCGDRPIMTTSKKSSLLPNKRKKCPRRRSALASRRSS
jgi:hypothetical protein